MNLVRRKLKELMPYEKNPRRNDKAVDAVVESIKQCGYVAPIIVDEDGVILAGHTRYKALKKLGRDEAEVIVRDGLTDEQKRKYRLLDNKTNELAEWDFDLLAEELDGLNFDGFDFGFDIGEPKNGTKNQYTKAINLPQYEPTGAKFAASQVYDASKVRDLICEIENSGVSSEEKDFLKAAAWRHCVINFEKAAELYANASPEMQGLMEHSALVIIDYDNAIANGFTKLTAALDELMDDDMDGT
jgi:hypothetical protein